MQELLISEGAQPRPRGVAQLGPNMGWGSKTMPFYVGKYVETMMIYDDHYLIINFNVRIFWDWGGWVYLFFRQTHSCCDRRLCHFLIFVVLLNDK